MKKELITYKNPKSPITEMFKTLRTNIQFMNSKKDLKTILITSTVPGEGKSWVAANLAITFAQADKKVLLIDADMRKGRLADLFQLPSKPGLSNLLSGINEKGHSEEIDISKIIKETEVDNLFLIPIGNIPPNPAELLGTEQIEKILKKFKQIFDIIILDGTPCELVTDSIILSRIVDTTIIVASQKLTKKESLEKVKRSIENVGGKIAGVILNRVQIKAKQYSTSYYYGSKSANSLSQPKQEKVEVKKEKKIKIEVEDSSDEMSDKEKDDIISQVNSYLNNKKQEK